MYSYEEIPEEQNKLIDEIYKSISLIDNEQEVKVNGDDNQALDWISNVMAYVTNSKSSVKPDIVFVD